jgi:hypothetical protein
VADADKKNFEIPAMLQEQKILAIDNFNRVFVSHWQGCQMQ